MSSDPKPVQVADAAGDARARRAQGRVAVWWRRVPRILWRPREVLLALRDVDEDDMAARQEPILAIVLLAGMAAVLLMGGTLVVDSSVDGAVVAAITFLAGGIYGAGGYLVLGLGVWVGLRGAGSEASFTQSRHVVAFAAVPVAVSVVPLALVVAFGYGLDFFRDGTGSSTVLALGLPFVAWAGALLVAGLRVTFQLAWLGVATVVALAAVLVAAFVTLPLVL